MNNQILLVHFKFYKSNYYFIVSNYLGRVIITKNSGNMGFLHIQKRGVEALSSLLETCLKEIILLKKNYLFIQIEGLKSNLLKSFYKYFIRLIKKKDITLVYLKNINKVAHNGCRRKK